MTDADEPVGPSFAQVLNGLLTARRLTQRQFARDIGTHEGNVSRWRRGGGIELTTVWRIADYFGLDRNYLARLAGYPDNSSPSVKASDGDLDPAMVALLDAEHRYAHEELVGIPPIYHRTIIEAGIDAGSAARRRAAELARQFLAGQGISNPAGRGVSKPSKGRRNLNRGGDDGAANRLTTTLPAYAGV